MNTNTPHDPKNCWWCQALQRSQENIRRRRTEPEPPLSGYTAEQILDQARNIYSRVFGAPVPSPEEFIRRRREPSDEGELRLFIKNIKHQSPYHPGLVDGPASECPLCNFQK